MATCPFDPHFDILEPIQGRVNRKKFEDFVQVSSTILLSEHKCSLEIKFITIDMLDNFSDSCSIY